MVVAEALGDEVDFSDVHGRNPVGPVRQYGLTVRPARGVEVAGSPTVFVG